MKYTFENMAEETKPTVVVSISFPCPLYGRLGRN